MRRSGAGRGPDDRPIVALVSRSGSGTIHRSWGAVNVQTSTEMLELFADWRVGDRSAREHIFRAVHHELRAIAAARLRQERNSSLSSGDLVNEAVIRLSRLTQLKFESKPHLLALASRIMRQALIDAARRKQAAKRYHLPVTLRTDLVDSREPADLIALDSALSELQAVSPEHARIVELRFFGGMTNADIAVVLGVSEPTVKRRWATTKAWLIDRLAA